MHGAVLWYYYWCMISVFWYSVQCMMQYYDIGIVLCFGYFAFGSTGCRKCPNAIGVSSFELMSFLSIVARLCSGSVPGIDSRPFAPKSAYPVIQVVDHWGSSSNSDKLHRLYTCLVIQRIYLYIKSEYQSYGRRQCTEQQTLYSRGVGECIG